MKKVYLILIALVLTACGGGAETNTSSNSTGTGTKKEAAPTKFTAKVDDKEYSLDIKDSVIWNSSLPYIGADGKQMKQGQHNIILGNYSFEGEPGRTLKADQVKVVVRLNGEIGTEDAPKLKAGIYSGGKITPMTIADFNIVIFQDGKEVQNYSSKFPAVEHKGEVKINSVEGDTVKGEIDVTVGGKWIVKGSFTAKFKQ